MRESSGFSPRFRLLLIIVVLLFVVNLLIMNDFVTIWSGAETSFVWNSLFGERIFFLPYRLAGFLSGDSLGAFGLRLPSAVVLLAGLAFFYLAARRFLGSEATLTALMALAASLVVPNTGKLATLDAWAFAVQAAGTGFLLLFLKKPDLASRLFFYFFLGFSLWFRPLSSGILFSVFPAILYFAHPQGRRLGKLYPWAAIVVGSLLLWLAGQWKWEWPGLLFSFDTGALLLAAVLGWLPFLGLVASGLVESLVKVRKGEELSVINMAWLAASLAAHSLVLHLVLALLVGKQLRAYFDPRYPYRGLVRTLSILHLLLVFFAAMFLMMSGFREFGGTGFRSGLAFGGTYWMLSLIGVFGLFGLNRRQVWGGMLFSGLLATFFFWSQVAPLLESRRDLPKRLLAAALEARPAEADELVISKPAQALHQSNIALYGRSGFSRVISWQSLAAGENRRENQGVWILKKEESPQVPERREVAELQGWNDGFQPVTYVLSVSEGD